MTTNDSRLLPDDPRLTAYALDELEAAERAAVEAAVRADPALQAAVTEIRATAMQLEAVFGAETAAAAAEPGAKPELRPAAILPGRDSRRANGGDYDEGKSGGVLLKFPRLYFMVGGLAAACFAVVVALRRDELDARQHARTVALETAMKDRAAAARSVVVQMPLAEIAAATSATAAVADSAPKTEMAAAAVASAPALSADRLAPRDLSLIGQAAANRAPKTVTAGTFTFSGTPVEPARQREAAAPPAASAQPATYTSNEAKIRGLAANAVGGVVLGSTGGAAGGIAFDTFTVAAPGRGGIAAPPPAPADRLHTGNTESYSFFRDNPFVGAAANPFSTFAVDVDTASYSNVRRFLSLRRLPAPDAVRIEELVNYFPYRYPAPQGPAPFAAALEVAEAPWAPQHRLVRIGLKGREVAPEARPAANLVFLVDVSGSMNQPNKLPLVKDSLRKLLGKLRPDDRVAIVTYAGQSGLALPSTPVARSAEILAALEALRPAGATNGGMGIHLAYDIAKANFAADGVNRVVLCTDGDFNVGVSSPGDLVRLVEEKAKSNVFLTVLGFGMGNLKDGTLEQLADQGNGQYGYIDTAREADKLFVEEVTSTLVTIAKDVKIQVEFNPAKVASYRLIGYENRLLAKEDFNNDKVDAGEVGAGHTVTALYEIVPVGVETPVVVGAVDERRYQAVAPAAPGTSASGELLTVKLRYKEPTGEVSRKLEFPLTDSGRRFPEASADFRFAAAVAEFGMILRKSEFRGTATMGDVIVWAAAGAANPADDARGYRSEFLDLARQAQELLKAE